MSYSDRFASIYFKPLSSSELLKLLKRIAQTIGVSLTYPETQNVSLISESGEQNQVSLEDFDSLMARMPVVRFQYWWNDSEDLYCRMVKNATFTLLEFSLNGTSVAQEQMVLDSLRNEFKELARKFAGFALIIDRSGRTAEYPWSDILFGQSRLTEPCADEVLLPVNSPCLQSFHQTYGHVIAVGASIVTIKPA